MQISRLSAKINSAMRVRRHQATKWQFGVNCKKPCVGAPSLCSWGASVESRHAHRSWDKSHIRCNIDAIFANNRLDGRIVIVAMTVGLELHEKGGATSVMLDGMVVMRLIRATNVANRKFVLGAE
jgi:hypothetical protein